MSSCLRQAFLQTSTRTVIGPIRKFGSTSSRSRNYLNADPDTFSKVTAAKDRLTLVDFYADWCAPCKQLSPILEAIAADSNARSGSGLPVDLVAIDTDKVQSHSLASTYNISNLPTVIAFLDGRPVKQFIGALPKPMVDKFLQSV